MVRNQVKVILALILALFPEALTLSHTERPMAEAVVPFSVVEETVEETYSVTASIYFPEEGQTDQTPLRTADGSYIDRDNPRKHRWIALSRNLLSRWGGDFSYGDTVLVTGISEELDGLYVVHDTMHRRFRNMIDILVDRRDGIMGLWKGIRLQKWQPGSRQFAYSNFQN